MKYDPRIINSQIGGGDGNNNNNNNNGGGGGGGGVAAILVPLLIVGGIIGAIAFFLMKGGKDMLCKLPMVALSPIPLIPGCKSGIENAASVLSGIGKLFTGSAKACPNPPAGKPIEGMACTNTGESCTFKAGAGNTITCYLHCGQNKQWQKRGNDDIGPRNVCTNRCPSRNPIEGSSATGLDGQPLEDGIKCRYESGTGNTLNCTCTSSGGKWTGCGGCKCCK